MNGGSCAGRVEAKIGNGSKARTRMASQRITIAKVGGDAAAVVLRRLQGWADARRTHDPDEWSGEQWPSDVRVRVDAFAERLRSHATEPPVIYYAEWADLWSMGDVFVRWLMPPGGVRPLCVHADRFEVYAYGLPDGGRLLCHLAGDGPHQFEEYALFAGRLKEAVEAWQLLREPGCCGRPEGGGRRSSPRRRTPGVSVARAEMASR